MLRRAVASFRAQTYENKRLLIWDTGSIPVLVGPFEGVRATGEIDNRQTVGALRNHANAEAQADILCHWDSDDLSHPNRIAEQVALLQASGADCVGYSDLLFWDTSHKWKGRRLGGDPAEASSYEWARFCEACGDEDTCEDFPIPPCRSATAWLYLGPQKALGTSLCYWRRTWEAKPFPDQPRPGFATGEDTTWIKGLDLCAVPSLGALDSLQVKAVEVPNFDGVRKYEPGEMTVTPSEPRMIASIHGSNTSGAYKLMEGSDSWRRVPEWDSYCSRVMSL